METILLDPTAEETVDDIAAGDETAEDTGDGTADIPADDGSAGEDGGEVVDDMIHVEDETAWDDGYWEDGYWDDAYWEDIYWEDEVLLDDGSGGEDDTSVWGDDVYDFGDLGEWIYDESDVVDYGDDTFIWFDDFVLIDYPAIDPGVWDKIEDDGTGTGNGDLPGDGTDLTDPPLEGEVISIDYPAEEYTGEIVICPVGDYFGGPAICVMYAVDAII